MGREDNEVAIVVQEGLGSDAEVTRKTHEFTREDAGTIESGIAIKAGAEVGLKYTVRVQG